MPKPSSAYHASTPSNTYRFFVAQPIRDLVVTLDDPQLAHQLSSVLRLRPGDRVVLLDNNGWEFTIELSALSRSQINGRVIKRLAAQGEPATQITLFLALIRPERFEWALQKGTELGASAFVPLICARSRATDVGARKSERWQRIVREAAEQSRRGRLPSIAPATPFNDACAAAARADLAVLLWEGDDVDSLRATLAAARQTTQMRQIAVLSGPEGGLTHDECKIAQTHGIIPVTLGPRTLRAETAPLAATVAILYELGEMDKSAGHSQSIGR